MSVLSDDTDVLLLIPPDFFLIPSDSEEEQLNKSASESLIVSDLITQVNDLEGRICLIEDRCLNETGMAGNLQNLRQYGSADTINCTNKSYLNTRSLQGTPSKSQWSPSKRCSLPLEMRENMLTSSDYVSQRDKDDRLLREIDQFFKQRKLSEGDCSDKCKTGVPLTKPENTQLSTAVFNLNKVNDLLKKLDETQKEIEEKVKLKELTGAEADDTIIADTLDELNGKTPMEESASEKIKSAKRVLSFDEDARKEESRDKNPSISSSDFYCGDDPLGNACVNSSKQKLTEELDKKIETKNSQEFNNLLSLSNLWGSTANVNKMNSHPEDGQVLKQRIQEERCRRQHCESLIHQLQLRLLEEQQKIAVAMKVDQEKDQAILKLTEGWNKLVGHWRDLENQRNNLAKKLLSDREKFKSEISGAFQTVKRYEVELSKALDLAHGYKEKCEASEKERKTLRSNAAKEAETAKSELRNASDKLRAEECKNEKLEKLLASKEELVNQSKAKISELQNQIREGKKTLRELQMEMENGKSEREKLMEKLREEKNRVAASEQSKKTLQQQNEELKRKEKALKDDMKTLTDQMEKVKAELKEFYQEQVESIVQEKLKEFQEQLSNAEKALQGEIEMREKTVTEMAVKQVQQIVEKHLQEIASLEEKHKEELELLKLQLIQKDEKVRDLQKKLEQYSSNKTLIAQRLHTVMEQQWQEALKIITSGTPQQVQSPPSSARAESDKPLARQNTFTMGSSAWSETSLNKSPTSASTVSTPFCQEGILTLREDTKGEPLTYRVDETPQKMTSDHLKKYIKALLERAPGHPTDNSMESTAHTKCIDTLTDESSLIRWQNLLFQSDVSGQVTSDASKYSETCLKPSKEIKPPWK